MRTIARVFAVALLSVGVAFPDGPCDNDATRICPRMSAISRRRCLETFSASLSPACRDVILVVQRVEQNEAAFNKACGGNIQRLCKIPPDRLVDVVACLRSKPSGLESACQAMLQPPTAAAEPVVAIEPASATSATLVPPTSGAAAPK
jgi:hypothetical protein